MNRSRRSVRTILFLATLMFAVFNISIHSYAQEPEAPEEEMLNAVKQNAAAESVPAIQPAASAGSIVAQNGRLRVDGRYLVDQYGSPVTLAGVSLYWHNDPLSQDCWSYNAVKSLVNDWGATVIRASVGINTPTGFNYGFAEPTWGRAYALAKLDMVVRSCVNLGVYVIIDYHTSETKVNMYEALRFFDEVSRRYGHLPNVIFEDWNEPKYQNQYMSAQERLNYWNGELKPFHEQVIRKIRSNGSQNVVIVGTGNWDQDVDIAANGTIKGLGSVAYALHFYARDHRSSLRAKVKTALRRNVCVFASEYGTTYFGGGGVDDAGRGPDYQDSDQLETSMWLNFLRENEISHCQWAVGKQREGSAALQPDSRPGDGIRVSDLTKSGRFVRSYLRQVNLRTFANLNMTDPADLVEGNYEIVDINRYLTTYPNQPALNIYQNAGAEARIVLWPYSHPVYQYAGRGNEIWGLQKLGNNKVRLGGTSTKFYLSSTIDGRNEFLLLTITKAIFDRNLNLHL